MDNEEIAIKTWEIYFPTEEYTIFNKEIDIIIEIRKDLIFTDDEINELKTSRILLLDYKKVLKYSIQGSTLRCVSCAASERIFERTNERIHLETRIVNFPSVDSFASVNTSAVGQLVNLVGTVCRVGYKKIENLEVFFECLKCSKIIKNAIKNNIYKIPVCSCKSKTMVFLPGHAEMKCVDKQEIKIQETYSQENSTAVIEVDLYNKFVGSVAPGDLIQIVGIVRAELCTDAYKLKIECNNLKIIKNKNFFDDHANCSETDFQMFKQISEEENLMSIFINNLYPNIFGNENIKAGLILSLFGGTKKYVGINQIRSEIHILIIGDPGLGKSKILLNTVGILPKSTYVSGNFCTTAGLTVSITHDPATGEYMADAGALVVADQGICCIDEFDKIDDHTALFEAMEDQVVTVAKGGVVCSVPTRSTIIAASNPKYGHFDQKKSIRENLKFDHALLSRFDLIYVLLDNLSEKENYDISNQILKKRMCQAQSSSESAIKKDVCCDQNISVQGANECDLINSDLARKIKDTNDSQSGIKNICVDDLLKNYHNSTLFANSNAVYSKEILKKYIEYARNTIKPFLSKSAMLKIKEYYLSLRDNKSVSIRCLESLIRLTESCAKMELKSIASSSHATFAINLYKKVFIKDEKNERKGVKVSVDDLLRQFVEDNQRSLIRRDELEELIRQADVKRSEGEYIEILNYRGVIIKKATGEYKINI